VEEDLEDLENLEDLEKLEKLEKHANNKKNIHINYMFDDDEFPMNTHWGIEEFNSWQPDSQPNIIDSVTHLIIHDEVVELSKLQTFFLPTLPNSTIPNLLDIELNGLRDNNDNEIPVIEILKLIKVNELPSLRRFQCNNRVYIPDNSPNINFNSEQAKSSGLRPFSKIKTDIDSIIAQNKYVDERKKLHTLNTLNVAFNKKEREQPGSIILPPEHLHTITTFLHKDHQPTSTVARRGENFDRILGNSLINNAKGGRRRTKKSRKSRRTKKSRKFKHSKRRKYKH
jgi:hypothetical protein